MRVLLLEDNADIATVLLEALRLSRYDAKWARTREEAFDTDRKSVV